jgi:NADH-quinone oxidoreductase subunit N
VIALLGSLSHALVAAQTPTTETPNPGGAATAPVIGNRAAVPSGVMAQPTIIWRALLPLIILALGALVLLTVSSLLRKKLPTWFYPVYTIVIAGASMIAVVPLWAQVQGWDHLWWWNLSPANPGAFSTFGSTCANAVTPTCGAIGVDGFGLAVTLVIGAAIILGALLASDYVRREHLGGPELYVLLLLSGAGGVVMAMANDLIVLFLGLETLSIAVYVLTAMHMRKSTSQEAGIKYFVLGAFSSAFFLYGIAMTYGATATTNLVVIKNLFSQSIAAPIPTSSMLGWNPGWHLNSPLLLLGIGLMIVGLGFKVAAVPFHFWSPDVYDGAPTPIVAYMASGVKVAGFAAMLRVFVLGFTAYGDTWRPIIAFLAAASMVVGAVLAIVQTNVKRTLAYSSISHAGFILMALQASSDQGSSAVLFYLITYTFMVAGSFAVVNIVARRGDGRVSLLDYRGLARTEPGLAFAFTVFLLAQAGIPFTTGFVAKLYTIMAAVSAHVTWLAILGMLASVISTFLYLRIITAMYMPPDPEAAGAGTAGDGAAPARLRIPLGARLAVGVCLLVTVGFGIFPGPLTDFANNGKPQLVMMPGDNPNSSSASTSPTGNPAAAAATGDGSSDGSGTAGAGAASSSGSADAGSSGSASGAATATP